MLSQAGRSILVQSVALACPTYTMAVTRFPKSINLKLDSLIRKFWWGSNSNGNSLMLKCWDSICKPKAFGGLGFRKLDDINTAMLSKLAWSIACNSDSLWVDILNAKYMRGKRFLTDNLECNNSSWLWKDITSCRDLICKGAFFKVDINSTISIWNEPWIPSLPGFIPDKSFILPNACNLNLLRDLMDSGSSSWKLETLKNIFQPDLVNEILKIQISPVNRLKTLLWSPSKSGKFSTRSAYLLSQSARFPPLINNDDFNWKNLWSCKLHNRLKLLLWRIVNNIIPCRAKLNCLFTINDTSCLFCNASMESVDHLFLLCPYIQQIWSLSYWHFNINTARSTPNQAWKKPPNGWYKINSDSTFDKGLATAGIVIRNWNGSVTHAQTQEKPCLEPLVAECIAIHEACLTAERLNISKAIFETDCLNAITAINGASLNSFWPVDPVVEKIKKAWTNWPMWTFSFTPRKNNCAAHELAKWAKTSSFVGIVPLDLIPINVFCDGGYPIVDIF
ncbi:hypothetical protein CASFOL_033941 [Castilleja foliolosa]|uniref:Uncharacterized protein n=1 Tax=Castilleja foliolosa TaxID=1961234 RepID=A0ABD3BYD9_9LAMI